MGGRGGGGGGVDDVVVVSAVCWGLERRGGDAMSLGYIEIVIFEILVFDLTVYSQCLHFFIFSNMATLSNEFYREWSYFTVANKICDLIVFSDAKIIFVEYKKLFNCFLTNL